MRYKNKYSLLFVILLLILPSCDVKHQNVLRSDIVEEYKDALILQPENMTVHGSHNWYYEIMSGPEKITLRAGSESKTDGKPIISLYYSQSSKTIVVWRYLDYQSIVDIRLSKNSTKLYYIINSVFPRLLWGKGENKRTLYVFDILKMKELGSVVINSDY